MNDFQTEWARLVARLFVECGLRNAVISPGSRSTPLALALFERSDVEIEVVVDERSAAFFALGQARASGRASLLLSTSGSAGAHYHPAILEAAHARVPLIALTADRPWELVGSGANQTTDQTKLFGSNVRGFFELGLPSPAALAQLPRIVAQAMLSARAPLPGPVHVNARFDKPLEPVASPGGEEWRSELERSAPLVHLPELHPSGSALERLTESLRRAHRVLVVAGPCLPTQPSLTRALANAVDALGAVFVAESASGLLHASETGARAFAGFETALIPAITRDPPDLIIELGLPLTSAAWLSLGSALSGVPRVRLGDDGLLDSTGQVSEVVLGDPARSLEHLGRPIAGREPDLVWQRRWSDRARIVESVLNQDGAGELVEPNVARVLLGALADGAVLFAGNSLPIRDLDAFGGRATGSIRVLHQRGLSGIDGLTAGAAGARSVTSPDFPVVALIGDVSALHDIGSLEIAARAKAPLVVVVIDNRGGRIFGELPIARAASETALKRLFLTPPPDFLESAAQAFGLAFASVADRPSFARELAHALGRPGATLLKVTVSPEASHAARRRIREQVNAELAQEGL